MVFLRLTDYPEQRTQADNAERGPYSSIAASVACGVVFLTVLRAVLTGLSGLCVISACDETHSELIS